MRRFREEKAKASAPLPSYMSELRSHQLDPSLPGLGLGLAQSGSLDGHASGVLPAAHTYTDTGTHTGAHTGTQTHAQTYTAAYTRDRSNSLPSDTINEPSVQRARAFSQSHILGYTDDDDTQTQAQTQTQMQTERPATAAVSVSPSLSLTRLTGTFGKAARFGAVSAIGIGNSTPRDRERDTDRAHTPTQTQAQPQSSFSHTLMHSSRPFDDSKPLRAYGGPASLHDREREHTHLYKKAVYSAWGEELGLTGHSGLHGDVFVSPGSAKAQTQTQQQTQTQTQPQTAQAQARATSAADVNASATVQTCAACSFCVVDIIVCVQARSRCNRNRSWPNNSNNNNNSGEQTIGCTSTNTRTNRNTTALTNAIAIECQREGRDVTARAGQRGERLWFAAAPILAP